MLPRVLGNGELRKLLAAQVPADFADWLDFVAIGALLAFVWQAPSIAYALLAVAMGAPYLLVGPFAGALVDRWSVRAVLIVSNLGRGAATAAFFLADDWPLLLALVALRSCVDSFFTPAKQTAIQALTDRAERASANGLSHAINQASKIVAPGAGATLLIWLAPGSVFMLNAGISALAAVLTMRLAPIRRPATGEDPETMFAGVRAGWGVVRQNPIIRTVLLMMAASYFAMFIYDTFIAPLTRELGFAPQHLGYALAASGAGGVLGSVVFTLLPDLRRPQYWVAAGTAVASVLLLILGGAELLGAGLAAVVLVAIFLVLGFVSAMSVVPIRVVLQNEVPDNRIASVTALGEAANMTALLAAPFLGAVLAEAISVGAPFVAGGMITLIVAAVAARAEW